MPVIKCVICFVTGVLISIQTVLADFVPDNNPDFNKLVQEAYLEPYKNGDIESWMKIFTDNAVGMHNTLPPLIGKDAIRQFGDMVSANMDIEQMDIIVDEIRINGTWALTRGSFISKLVPKTATNKPDIKPQTGKFILLWEQQGDKTWKIILDMGNSNKPPPDQ